LDRNAFGLEFCAERVQRGDCGLARSWLDVQGVDPTLTLVANYLLCIESFARMATLNCERSGPHPAKPSRDALAECVGGDNRPIFLNRTNVKSLDVAQVGDT